MIFEFVWLVWLPVWVGEVLVETGFFFRSRCLASCIIRRLSWTSH